MPKERGRKKKFLAAKISRRLLSVFKKYCRHAVREFLDGPVAGSIIESIAAFSSPIGYPLSIVNC